MTTLALKAFILMSSFAELSLPRSLYSVLVIREQLLKGEKTMLKIDFGEQTFDFSHR